jgi:hypothetical protein
MPTLSQLKEAVAIAEQIEKLQSELAGIIGGNDGFSGAPAPTVTTPVVKTGKRIFSAESRAKMAAAQAARWAKVKGPSAGAATAVALESSVASKAKKGKRVMSAEGRARIAAAQRARHAAKRKNG